MKRSLCLGLSIILVVSVLAPCYMVIEKNNYEKNVALFCSNVNELNKKYNLLTPMDVTDENAKPVYSAYENRLIVRADVIPENLNYTDSVSGIGYNIFQYSNSNALQTDFEMLKNAGCTVIKDKIYFINDIDAASEVSVLANGYDYGTVGEKYAKSQINALHQKYEDIIVAVLDSGVEYTHELLASRMDSVKEPNFSSSGEADSSMDDNGHGTMVSGIIVQTTPNNVKIRPYKLANQYGTMTSSEIICALEYILSEKNKPDIINMSFGGFDMVDGQNEIQNDLVSRLVESGITVCTSAGNDFSPSECYSPASCEASINVGSCNSYGAFSDFSNFGNAVDISAPGEYIYTST